MIIEQSLDETKLGELQAEMEIHRTAQEEKLSRRKKPQRGIPDWLSELEPPQVTTTGVTIKDILAPKPLAEKEYSLGPFERGYSENEGKENVGEEEKKESE